MKPWQAPSVLPWPPHAAAGRLDRKTAAPRPDPSGRVFAVRATREGRPAQRLPEWSGQTGLRSLENAGGVDVSLKRGFLRAISALPKALRLHQPHCRSSRQQSSPAWAETALRGFGGAQHNRARSALAETADHPGTGSQILPAPTQPRGEALQLDLVRRRNDERIRDEFAAHRFADAPFIDFRDNKTKCRIEAA